MLTVPISKLRASLGKYLAAVRRGEEVIVTERGKPVAKLVKVDEEVSRDDRRNELIRRGLLRPRKRRLGPLAPPPGEKNTGVLEALLDEREHGR